VKTTSVDPVVHEYASQARDYDKTWSFYIEATTAETLKRMPMSSHARVLDVGCGTGELLLRLRGKYPEATLAGIDPVVEMLAVAKEKLSGKEDLQVGYAAVLLAAAPLARASDKHGGHEVEVGKYHVELVIKDRDVLLYVRDQADKAVDAKSVKASANALSGKDKATVELAPAGEGLKGQAPFSVRKDAKVVVTFSVAGAKSEQARFSLAQKQEHKGHKH
jgi:SAM-dependent methyltransferase